MDEYIYCQESTLGWLLNQDSFSLSLPLHIHSSLTEHPQTFNNQVLTMGSHTSDTIQQGDLSLEARKHSIVLTCLSGTGIALIYGVNYEGKYIRDLYLQDSDGSLLVVQFFDDEWQSTTTILDAHDKNMRAKKGTQLAAVCSNDMSQVRDK
jgi:hypothetical protein